MERGYQGKPVPEERTSRRTFLRRFIGLSGKGEEASLVDTVKLATAFTLSAIASSPVASAAEEQTGLRINQGSKAHDNTTDLLLNYPLFFYLAGSVVAPLFEEAVFRLLPSALLPKRLGTMWEVGIPSAATFAVVHNLSFSESTKEPIMNFDAVPAYQFIAGLLFWKLARERGYMHAVVAHSTYNSIIISGAYISGLKV